MSSISFPLHYFTFWSASVTALFVSMFTMENAFLDDEMMPVIRVIRAFIDTSATLVLLQSLVLMCTDVGYSVRSDMYFKERKLIPKPAFSTAGLSFCAIILFSVHDSLPAYDSTSYDEMTYVATGIAHGVPVLVVFCVTAYQLTQMRALFERLSIKDNGAGAQSRTRPLPINFRSRSR